jgi:hypothetical protein
MHIEQGRIYIDTKNASFEPANVDSIFKFVALN